MPGKPIMVQLKLKNVGDKSFSFMDGGQQRGPRNNQFGFIAHQGSGYGRAVPDTGDPTTHGGKAGLITLKPGDTFTKQVDVTKWFQFKKPDSYKLTCMYEIRLTNATSGLSHSYTLWDDFAVGECIVRVKK